MVDRRSWLAVLCALSCGCVAPREEARPTPGGPDAHALSKAGGAAFEKKDFAGCLASFTAAAEAERRDPDGEASHRLGALYDAACCAALAGKQPEALRLLAEAVEAGFSDASQLESDEDLASLRAAAGWAGLVAAARARAAAEAALPDPWAVAPEQRRKGNFLAVAAELERLEPSFKGTSRWGELVRAQAVASALLGDHVLALRQLARVDRWREPDTGALAGLRPADAVTAIAAAAKDRQLVLLNEARHVGAHRAFAIRLLRALHAQGFRWLAAELVAEDSQALQARGWPKTATTGPFADEPLAGELIRIALSLGFHVVGYGAEPACEAGRPPVECDNLRERGEALNVKARIFDLDPRAKVLLLASDEHVHEDRHGDAVPMAVSLREVTGLDPLTVDQLSMSERAEPRLENPLYAKALALGVLAPSVLLDAKGAIWVEPSLAGSVDVVVVHPRTVFVRDRPAWRLLDGRVAWVAPAAELCRDRPRCQLDAVLRAEGEDAVPVDRVVVPRGRPTEVLVLPPGAEVLVRARAASGELLGVRTVTAR